MGDADVTRGDAARRWGRWTGAPIILLAAGCQFDPVIYLPVRVEAYALPDNRIPDERLLEVSIEVESDVTLAAMWATQPEPDAAATVLFFHGQLGNLDNEWKKVMNIYEGGCNVLAVDYRGFGKSTGTPSEPGLYADARASWDFLLARAEIDASRVVVWGFSLGGGVASHLATEERPVALVLEAPFTSLSAMIEHSGPYAPDGTWVTEERFPNLARMPGLEVPLVVVHGTDDLRIPYWMGAKVFAAAPEPKRFVSVEGGRHDNLLKLARDEVFAALDEVAPSARTPP